MERGERRRRRRYSEIGGETNRESEGTRTSVELRKILEKLEVEESPTPEKISFEEMKPVDVEFQKKLNELVEGVRETKEQREIDWKKEMLELTEDVSENSERVDRRGEHREITMPQPELRGEKIDSFEELREKIEKEFPGLKENPKYDEWMKDAEDYMKLHHELARNPNITPEELREISREMGLPRTKSDGWIHQEKEPRLIKYTREAMTASEGCERVREIKAR